MRKVALSIAITVLLLAFLSLFGWVVKGMAKGEKPVGSGLEQVISTLIGFPDLFKETVKEIETLPETFVKTPENFESINRLEEDVLALISYSGEGSERIVELKNLKDDNTRYKWSIEGAPTSQSRIMHALLLSDKSLCYSFTASKGIVKIDSLSNEVWRQDSLEAHHSYNLDSVGNIWVCTYGKLDTTWPIYYNKSLNIDWRELSYIDNCISKLDAKTGQVLFHKSLTDILAENDLNYLYMKTAKIEDPFHVNDIEPALRSTPYYNEGDVFISCRNISSVIHYRPLSNKVIRLIEGPFYNQHDVDFIGDSAISIFNNNAPTVWQNNMGSLDFSSQRDHVGSFYSNYVVYNFKTESCQTLLDSAFAANGIASFTEGLTEELVSGNLFVEEQNTGELWVLSGDKVVYKNVIPSQHQGYHHLPNWTRIILEDQLK